MDFKAANTFNFCSLYNYIGANVNGYYFSKYNDHSIIVSDTTAWPNGLYDIKTSGRTHNEVIESIYRTMSELETRPLIISADDEEFDRSLRTSGNLYYPVEQWKGMYRPLQAYVPVLVDSPIFAASLRSDADIEAWCKVVSGSLFKGKVLTPAVFNFLLEKGHQLVALWKDDVIVGTALIYRDECNISGLYLVSVVEEFRGRGLGRLILTYCLKTIRDGGGGVCLLQSTKAGLKLYESLGFVASNLYNLFLKLK